MKMGQVWSNENEPAAERVGGEPARQEDPPTGAADDAFMGQELAPQAVDEFFGRLDPEMLPVILPAAASESAQPFEPVPFPAVFIKSAPLPADPDGFREKAAPSRAAELPGWLQLSALVLGLAAWPRAGSPERDHTAPKKQRSFLIP